MNINKNTIIATMLKIERFLARPNVYLLIFVGICALNVFALTHYYGIAPLTIALCISAFGLTAAGVEQVVRKVRTIRNKN